MKELWLKFRDENGADRKVLVEGKKFSVGRTPENDLQISLPALSRKHIEIERFADVFVVSDCNSSNGTKLNNSPLTEPAGLQNGDKLKLGDYLEIETEIASDEEFFADASLEQNASGAEANTAGISAQNVSSAPSGGGIPTSIFILAPLLGFFVLAIIGGLIYLFSGKTETAQAKKDEFVYQPKDTSENADSENEEEGNTNSKKSKADENADKPTVTPSNVNTNSQQETVAETPQKVSSETDKIERASISFLRRIAANDSTAFLTSDQIGKVNPLINQFKNSPALAENLKNAKRDAGQIEALAKSKNLRPQFVAAAALAKLGNRQGNVLQTAQSMLEILSNLRTSLGDELANDALLIIAAYDQGEAGKNLAMRDTVANLVNKFPNVSSRTIRTIWFLREQGKLSDSEFDFVLKFLAVGTIMQNPSDFNVKAEAIVFN